jgi:hypothetical protein
MLAGESAADHLVGIPPTATDGAPVLTFRRGLHAVLSVRVSSLTYLHFISRRFSDSGIQRRFQGLPAKNPWKKYFLDRFSGLTPADDRATVPVRVATQF